MYSGLLGAFTSQIEKPKMAIWMKLPFSAIAAGIFNSKNFLRRVGTGIESKRRNFSSNLLRVSRRWRFRIRLEKKKIHTHVNSHEPVIGKLHHLILA